METRCSGSQTLGTALILLVSGLSRNWAQEYLRRGANVGFLAGPRSGFRLKAIRELRIQWSADNDCFQGLDRDAFMRMLNAYRGLEPAPMWVACPDVVANAQATLASFEEWEPIIHGYGYPVALVLQDGQEKLPVPWNRIEAVFLGGSTAWKLGYEAHAFVQEARQRGKLCHMGRVNSQERIRIASSWGCDSVDGSGFSRWRKLIEPGTRWLRRAERLARDQPELFR